MGLPASPLSVFVVGTRAQLIKIAPVIKACEQLRLPALLLFTGQHKDTMQDLVHEFSIRTEQENVVEVAERSTVGSLLAWVPKVLLALRRRLKELSQQHPSLNVVVHGDTLSAAIGALAAKWCGAKVFHVESGLSSGHLFDPFPEEMARRFVFRLTDVALCPDQGSAELMRSRYRCQVIDTQANTIVDSVYLAMLAGEAASAEGNAYLVVSLHRFQNIFDGARLAFLVGLIESLAVRFPVHFVLHPATRKRLESGGYVDRLRASRNVNLSPRLGYSDFLRLAAGACCVLTDGGSNQEELAVLGVPTIVMRQRTERSDGLGTNARMEADIEGGVYNYLIEDRFLELRRQASRLDGLGPSLRIAQALAEPASH